MSTIIKLLSKYGYIYVQGLGGTLWLSVVTVGIASILGTLVSILKMSRIKIFQFIVNVYIDIIRGTPLLLQIYFFWLILPKMMPIRMSDTTCIVVALIVNSTAYVAEIVRAGIQAVDPGQREAAMSLGMSHRNMMIRIILPQAIKNILPAIGNEFIAILKETSMASIFFVMELTTAYKTVQNATYKYIPSLLISGVIYFTLTFTLTRLLGIFERKLKSNDR